MTLQWRAGASHHLPDALPRLPRFAKKSGEDVDDSSPDEISRPGRIFNGPRGPVLDGIPLSDLGVQQPSDSPPRPSPCVATYTPQGPDDLVSLMAIALVPEPVSSHQDVSTTLDSDNSDVDIATLWDDSVVASWQRKTLALTRGPETSRNNVPRHHLHRTHRVTCQFHSAARYRRPNRGNADATNIIRMTAAATTRWFVLTIRMTWVAFYTHANSPYLRKREGAYQNTFKGQVNSAKSRYTARVEDRGGRWDDRHPCTIYFECHEANIAGHPGLGTGTRGRRFSTSNTRGYCRRTRGEIEGRRLILLRHQRFIVA